MTTHSLTIPFRPDQAAARPAPSWWLRIDNANPVDDARQMTMTEAAKAVDNLFGLEPCEDTTGGQPATDDDLPDEDAVDDAIMEAVGADQCGPDPVTGQWTCLVKIYRSDTATPYRLVCLNGRIEQTIRQPEQVVEVIAAQGKASVNLAKPVIAAGEFSGQPIIELIGQAMLWFGGPEATSFISASYQSEHDLATITVNGGADGNPQPCRLVAFYHGMAIEAEILPPEEDKDTDQALRCGAVSYTATEYDKPARCRQAITHHVRCSCFDHEEISSYDTEEEVECPDDARCPAGFSGCDYYLRHRHVDEYVSCTSVTSDSGGDVIRETQADWDGADPDFYEDKCCDSPPFALPLCQENITTYRGGAEIDGGAEKYRQKYGEDVQLIAVSPPGGICGTHTIKQIVRQKSCCDEVEVPLAYDSDNSIEVIADNSTGLLYVTGGRAPFSWSVRGTGFFFRGGVVDAVTEDRYINLYTGDACGTATVTVTDGCSTVTAAVRSVNGQWPEGKCVAYFFKDSSAALISNYTSWYTVDGFVNCFIDVGSGGGSSSPCIIRSIIYKSYAWSKINDRDWVWLQDGGSCCYSRVLRSDYDINVYDFLSAGGWPEGVEPSSYAPGGPGDMPVPACGVDNQCVWQC